MPSELRRPPLPDTPDFFGRVEGELRQEAARIKARRVARQRRSRWYENLRPAVTAGAVIAALVVLFPLVQGETGPSMSTAVSDPGVANEAPVGLATGVGGVHLDRLPAEDIDAIGGSRLWPDKVA